MPKKLPKLKRQRLDTLREESPSTPDDVERGSRNKRSAKSKSKAKTKTQTRPSAQAKSKAKTQTKPSGQAKPKAKTQTKPSGQAKPKTKTQTKPSAKPKTKTAAKTVKSTARPTVNAKIKATTRSKSPTTDANPPDETTANTSTTGKTKAHDGHAEPTPDPRSPKPSSTSRRPGAKEIIDRYVRWTALGGAIPLPWVDTIAIGALQLKMLATLSSHYGVPFSEERGRSLVLALTGSVAPSGLGAGLGRMVARSMPAAGLLVGVATTSALSATATAVMGSLFVDHLEVGGTVYDVNATTMKKSFARSYQARAS